jgi:DNA-binding LacI/PurR family transcriptional regulator
MAFGAAVETGLDHLARLGHTCVALFNFPPDLLDAGLTAAVIAQEVFERRAAEMGIRGIHLLCSHEPHEAFAVAARLLRSEPECTAALTTGWRFTGLLGALRAADRRIPNDFSVVSVIASQFAEMLTPSLTGVEWPAFEAGHRAGEMLIEQLTVRGAPIRQHLVPAQLVVRESTGPAPRRWASGTAPAAEPDRHRLARAQAQFSL